MAQANSNPVNMTEGKDQSEEEEVKSNLWIHP